MHISIRSSRALHTYDNQAGGAKTSSEQTSAHLLFLHRRGVSSLLLFFGLQPSLSVLLFPKGPQLLAGERYSNRHLYHQRCGGRAAGTRF